jgi:hypothetical protein
MTAPTSAYAHDEARRVLARTPDALDALLADAPDAVLDADEGPGTWSPRQVVVHLINGERANWIPRIRLILEGAGRRFEPFDRVAGFSQAAGTPIDALLREFRRARADNLAALDALGVRDADLGLTGTHPEFGTVTLGQQLATWVAHDLSHLAQVTRVMAKRYQQDVGPWAAYLSVFRQRTDGGA